VEDLLGTRVAGLDGPVRLLLALALSADLRADELTALEGAHRGRRRRRVARPRAPCRTRCSPPPLQTLALARSGVMHVRWPRRRRRPAARPAPRARHRSGRRARGVAQRGGGEGGGARRAAPGRPLAEHALRLTPPQSPERDERLLSSPPTTSARGRSATSPTCWSRRSTLPPAARPRAPACCSATAPARARSGDVEQHLTARWPSRATTRDPRARALPEGANGVASSVERLTDAEAWALAALSAGAGVRDTERRALYARLARAPRSGASIDELCERSAAMSDTSSYITTSPSGGRPAARMAR
jgi:hypothetical protein